MTNPYIGITGFTNPVDVGIALSGINSKIKEGSNYKLMIGVLVNLNTLHGKPSNHFPARYPPINETNLLFPDSEDVLNFYHYNTSSREFQPELQKLIQYGGPNLNGFQLNMTWPDPKQLEEFRKKGNTHKIVLQIGSKAFTQINNNPTTLVNKINKEYGELVDYVLLDPSGGTGKDMDIETTRRYLSEIYNDIQNKKLKIGIAGGLSSKKIHEILPLISEFKELSIDAEGKLRGNPGDWLSIREMLEYQKEAYYHLVETSLINKFMVVD